MKIFLKMCFRCPSVLFKTGLDAQTYFFLKKLAPPPPEFIHSRKHVHRTFMNTSKIHRKLLVMYGKHHHKFLKYVKTPKDIPWTTPNPPCHVSKTFLQKYDFSWFSLLGTPQTPHKTCSYDIHNTQINTSKTLRKLCKTYENIIISF